MKSPAQLRLNIGGEAGSSSFAIDLNTNCPVVI